MLTTFGASGVDLGWCAPAPAASDTLDRITDFYQAALPHSAPALAFLAHLGLADPTLIRHFRLGFSDRTLGRAVPTLAAAATISATGLRAALRAEGLLRASGHEHFAGCIVVPLVDAAGSVQQCYGRRIAAPRGAPRPARALPNRQWALWNAAAIAESGDLILCDDVLDALLFWSVGQHRVLAVSHPTATADALADLLTRADLKRVQVAFAATAEGNHAARRVADALAAIGIGAQRVPLPRGFDVCTFARVHAPAAASLCALLQGVLPARRVGARSGSPSPPMQGGTITRPVCAAPAGLESDAAAHVASLLADGFAPATTSARRAHLQRWAGALAVGGVTRTAEVTAEGLERARMVLARMGMEGAPERGGSTQANLITAVRMFFAWAVRTRHLATDPTAGLERPRLPRRLPRAILSASEAERVLARPDPATTLGLRDRAILEVFYSTGIRRMELIGLDLPDLDAERGVLFIREGKGRKDRLVPIGDRAIHWTHRYLDHTRPQLLRDHDPGAIFLGARGARMRPTRLTERMHGYVLAAGLGKSGSCHIFRHTMATLMHDGGADIRDLQEMLGHALLSTTQIYTHVSIARLKAVHTRTHPARFAGNPGVAARLSDLSVGRE